MPSQRRVVLSRLLPKRWRKKVSKSNSNIHEKAAQKTRTLGQQQIRLEDPSETEKDGIHGVGSCHYLQETPICRPVALLDRSEVRVGELLGCGSFCEVFEVKSFALKYEFQSSDLTELCSSFREGLDLDDSEIRRQELAEERFPNGKARYALKRLALRLQYAPEEFCTAAADLIHEASYMLRFDHPNILKVHGMAVDGPNAFDKGLYDGFFFITDRLSGTLHEEIKAWKREGPKHRVGDPRNLILKTTYALELASALEYLHERRILFRDVKPQNIGLSFEDKDQRRSIQLFDFGFCRELPFTSSKESCEADNEKNRLYLMSRVGSPAYIAPEVMLHGGRYNAKADVYSFSIVYFEMLFLKRELGRMSRFQSYESVAAKGSRPDLSKENLVPACIQSLLRATWQQSVSERISIRDTRVKLKAILRELQHSQSRVPSSQTVVTEIQESGSMQLLDAAP